VTKEDAARNADCPCYDCEEDCDPDYDEPCTTAIDWQTERDEALYG